MDIRSTASLPTATPAAARPQAATEAGASEAAAPKDEIVVQSSILTSGAQFSIPETMAEVGTYGRKIPDGRNRIDSIHDVLHMDKVHDMGITGKGVTVAVIDTGIFPHEDIKSRIIGWKDMVNGRPEPYDDNGHGTHCAGLVGGDGHMAGGRFQGAAPDVNLVGVKVLSGEGGGAMSDVIRGIEWAIENKDRYNIRVLSMSLGAPALQKEKYDLVAKAVAKAYDAGILPVVAAGNSGPFLETIGSPAISSKAFTVGAYDDKNTADLGDDTMAFFSSRGPTTADRSIKPDIASPGVNMVSTLSYDSMIDHENIPRYGDDYILLSGTSMATPVMAGVAADILQANPDLTPQQVIDLVKSTALPVADQSKLAQGAGLVNPVAAVEKALAMRQQAEATQA